MKLKPFHVAAGLALALGLATSAQAQYLPTNTIDLAEYNSIFTTNPPPQALTDTGTQPLEGMPTGITATWKWSGWSFFVLNDWTTWGATYANPDGATAGFDCRGGSWLLFSSPVII